MQLPSVAPAPLVVAHADALQDLFENRRQLHHFPHYVTGLIVLDNTSLTNIARCVLESADKTNLSRFFSDAELTGTSAVLVTNRVDWNAQRILTLYVQRWPIEMFYSHNPENH